MKLRIHRGTHEIGGSCVEIQQGESRIIIDIGTPLSDGKEGRFDLKKYRLIPGPELVSRGILPDIKGFYEWDKNEKPINALLISHAHQDHYGFLKFVRSDIKVYLGEPTRDLIKLCGVFTSARIVIKNPRFFKSGEEFSCGDFSITPFLMDHSAFDSHSFVVQEGSKRLIYSGDFRDHGRKPGALRRFLAGAPREADVLLLEGTNLGREDGAIKTEKNLEDEIVGILKNSPGFVMVCLSSQNIDRLVTIYKACIRLKKIFAIDLYTANVLFAMKEYAKLPYPNQNYPEIKVFFFPKNLCRKIRDEDRIKMMFQFKHFKIERKDIDKNRDKVMMLVRPSMLGDLKEIFKDGEKIGGVLIYSLWKGYKESEDTKKLLDFAEKKGIKIVDAHTSGHADLKTLKKVVVGLKPKVIIPIHTTQPGFYQDHFGSAVRKLEDRQVWEL